MERSQLCVEKGTEPMTEMYTSTWWKFSALFATKVLLKCSWQKEWTEDFITQKI